MPNKTQIIAEPGKLELFIIREFDAPRELLFKAHTEVEIYRQWLGCKDMTTEFKTFEAKDGGYWNYVSRYAGHEFGFHGVYHEVLFPERIISTFEFDGLPEKGHVVLATYKFEELPGNRSRLVSQSLFQTLAARDGMLQSGMEGGVEEGFEKLDDLLSEQQKVKGVGN